MLVTFAMGLPLLAELAILLDEWEFFGGEDQGGGALAAGVAGVAEGDGAGLAALAVDNSQGVFGGEDVAVTVALGGVDHVADDQVGDADDGEFGGHARGEIEEVGLG